MTEYAIETTSRSLALEVWKRLNSMGKSTPGFYAGKSGNYQTTQNTWSNTNYGIHSYIQIKDYEWLALQGIPVPTESYIPFL